MSKIITALQINNTAYLTIQTMRNTYLEEQSIENLLYLYREVRKAIFNKELEVLIKKDKSLENSQMSVISHGELEESKIDIDIIKQAIADKTKHL